MLAPARLAADVELALPAVDEVGELADVSAVAQDVTGGGGGVLVGPEGVPVRDVRPAPSLGRTRRG